MFDFILVFSVICLDSWRYIGWGHVRVFEKFRSLYSFLPFFFFSCFSFLPFFFFSSLHFCCLSLGAPLAPGPLDIVHPCHPVATPLHLLRNYNDSSDFRCQHLQRRYEIPCRNINFSHLILRSSSFMFPLLLITVEVKNTIFNSLITMFTTSWRNWIKIG